MASETYGVLEVVIAEAAAELWDVWCLEQGASGSEWEGGAAPLVPPDWVEPRPADAMPKVSPGMVRVRHFFEIPQLGSLPSDPDTWRAGFRTRFPGVTEPTELTWRIAPVEAWATQWRQHFVPLVIGERFVICPPWDAGVGTHPGRLRIVIDPGQGFGTGRHATTALALQMLERAFGKLAAPAQLPARMLDVGTGSGILLIAARLLGVPEAWACDVDTLCEPELQRNLALSGIGEAAHFMLGGPERVLTAGPGTFPLVVANITSPVLTAHAADLRRLTSPRGDLILSGMLEDEVEAVVAAIAGNSTNNASEWARVGLAEAEGWVSMHLRRVTAGP